METISIPRLVAVTTTFLTGLVGAAGMLVSFCFLASWSELNVIAGAAGFVAGAVLASGSLISFALMAQASAMTRHVERALAIVGLMLAPAVAGLAWPALFFTLFLGGFSLAPVVLLICVWISIQASAFASRTLFQSERGRAFRTRAILVAIQLALVLTTIPAFELFLRMLESCGFKIGWS